MTLTEPPWPSELSNVGAASPKVANAAMVQIALMMVEGSIAATGWGFQFDEEVDGASGTLAHLLLYGEVQLWIAPGTCVFRTCMVFSGSRPITSESSVRDKPFWLSSPWEAAPKI
jgi:hypothetical protein